MAGNLKKNSKKCSKGQILREGYTTKTNKKVPSSCITAQSATGKKTSLEVKKYLEKNVMDIMNGVYCVKKCESLYNNPAITGKK